MLVRAPSPPLMWQLRSIAQFGAQQLAANAVVVVDERRKPAALVACEGPEREQLLGCPHLLAILGDARGLRPSRSDLDALGPISVTDIALEGGDRLATLYVLGSTQRPAQKRDMRSGHTAALARQVALALSKPRSDQHGLARRDAGREWLTELDALPSLPDAITRLTPMVSSGLSALLGVGAACLVVWDEERSMLRALPGSFGTSNLALSDSISGPPTNPHSLTSRVFVTGQPYMTNDASGDPSLHQQYVDVFGLRSVLAVPLTVDTHRAGVLMVADKAQPFTVGDVVELERLAPRIATAVQLTLSIEKIRRSQRMDRILAQAATEVASGKGLEECLEPALRALGEATGSAMAVLSQRTAAPVVWRGSPVEAELELAFLTAAQGTSLRAAGAFPHDAGDPGWAAAHAPVLFSGDLVAAVSLMRRTGMPFGIDEEESLGRLADLAALAWASSRYQRQMSELVRSRERARIADELHDHVAQIMFAAQIGLDSLLEEQTSPETGEEQRLKEIRALLTTGEAAVRAVIDECAPAPQANLVRRLENTAAAVDEQFHALVELALPCASAVAGVPRPVADCVVKVAHEATINAVKHAGSCRISLSVCCAGNVLTLRVRDDGTGGHPAEFARRHGINSMERAAHEIGGSLSITRRPDVPGTQVKMSVALEL